MRASQLTAFLREAGAPLDNNICESAIILERTSVRPPFFG
jgi:hypothetical protein